MDSCHYGGVWRGLRGERPCAPLMGVHQCETRLQLSPVMRSPLHTDSWLQIVMLLKFLITSVACWVFRGSPATKLPLLAVVGGE